MKRAYWYGSLAVLLLLALALRLHGIGNPILDHPGWRQGDTAGIARNFALYQFNIMYPQTTYNGPPPNYVELELQIVPFLAASLYKLFGVHEIFGRLITLGFSLATVAIVTLLGRWLFGSAIAGLAAGFFYAVFPGSVYYGRTFTPDCAMVFFLTAALYAAARTLLDRDKLEWGDVLWTTALLALAYLAKPVAMLGIAPLIALVWQRVHAGKKTPVIQTAILFVLPLLVFWLYDRRVASYAEWHWASGITKLHVLPALKAALTGLSAFAGKLTNFRIVLGMLRDTMLGGVAFLLSIAAFAALPWVRARSRAFLWAWLGGGLLYVFVVVTVERVDYYMYPLLPLCALSIGGLFGRVVELVRGVDAAPTVRYALLALVALVGAVALGGRTSVAAYYDYNAAAYRNALALNEALPRDALVVIGHYGPDVQYYLNRFGWEEDPIVWTPFDEESAIRKGARYFVSIEDRRLRRNLELCAWLARFPVVEYGGWRVYQTSPDRLVPNAEAFWRAFRTAERAGHGRAFLTAHNVCTIPST
ncbi:MAG TPA: glycosyltransferase family 39 protein [Candidatus Cybelea sp.]